jgi:hypothetical protein
MIVLAPGQTISGEVTFRTHIDGRPATRQAD